MRRMAMAGIAAVVTVAAGCTEMVTQPEPPGPTGPVHVSRAPAEPAPGPVSMP